MVSVGLGRLIKTDNTAYPAYPAISWGVAKILSSPVRGYPLITLAYAMRGGGGVKQMLTFTNRGGGRGQ